LAEAREKELGGQGRGWEGNSSIWKKKRKKESTELSLKARHLPAMHGSVATAYIFSFAQSLTALLCQCAVSLQQFTRPRTIIFSVCVYQLMESEGFRGCRRRSASVYV
jgi:hypothetical protein